MRPLEMKVSVALFLLIMVGSVFAGWTALTYNGLVAAQADVNTNWAQVENQYQRKIDLIPRLIETVSQYQQFEAGTLQNITRLRSQWLNASGIDQRVNITNALNAQLYRLTLTYENYPTLHSDYLVAGLMDELAGTENRIAVERARYNDSVRDYNVRIHSFPGVVIAGSLGFKDSKLYDPIPGGP